ncbi:MAG: putative DNA binding domain-containing protein [Anaerolineae bacterium]|nr:putative DNA binding domain-containing protein [Anaerolineae bacterium]
MAQSQEQWYKAELHIHTPGSADFQQEGVTFLDILREAERKGIDIMAFTDHNTVAGYRAMQEEIDDLELLERVGRLNNQERQRLQEYRRLLDRVLLLKGFEFTATFGFHILGIFDPDTPLRDLEFLLLRLNLPPDKLDDGATDMGATSDVLTAYQMIARAGGIVIAAHANSSNGVALHGLQFGGQTRIAFTQDPNLHALEVTDLERKTGKTTARFFDGSKPEYPRRMRCIQGSDAHRLTRQTDKPRNLGVGDRVTEVLLKQRSFAALREVFLGDDFARTRPYRPQSLPVDFVQTAREEGPNIVQDFHERYSTRGGYRDAIIADICAFANTNGGTLYIGVPPDAKKPPTGVGASPTRVVNLFQQEVQQRVTPELQITADIMDTAGQKVVRIVVPRGPNPPYALDESGIYIRSEAETTMAVRDEIVELTRRGLGRDTSSIAMEPEIEEFAEVAPSMEADSSTLAPPRTGVEIAEVVERNGTQYYTMRDLRNGSLVNNVTKRSARHLWRYAIEEAETNPVDPNQIRWLDDIGIWKQREYRGRVRWDLVQRDNGTLRVYYGVAEEGIHDRWAVLVEEE